MKTQQVWTEGYFPFTMGGSVHRPMIMELPVEELGGLHDLGKGYTGWVLYNPETGDTYLVESQSGAIIGGSLKEVKQDIATASEGVMQRQIEQAKERVKQGTVVEVEFFWAHLQRNSV